MKSSIKSLKILLVGVLIFSVVFSTGITEALSKEQTVSNIEDRFEILVETDDFLSYIVRNNDGSLHLFEETVEEDGDNTIITTSIYDVRDKNDKRRKLIDRFQTNITTDLEGNIIVSEGYNNKGKGKGKGNQNISDGVQFIEDQNSLNNEEEEYPLFTTMSTSWTMTAAVSGSFGYMTNYSTNRGNARYSGINPKRNLPRDAKYTKFTQAVDSLRSRERTILRDATGVALLEAIWQVRNTGITLQVVKQLVRKVGAPAFLAYEGFMWFLAVNSSRNAYYAL
ncbi:hypothetical protein [Halalkalibacter lacteus]|uniref:hypothetical protein n=1 Tax=Halalkalibacter lacteus TaxID=3090663 RepID=UPI002FC82800